MHEALLQQQYDLLYLPVLRIDALGGLEFRHNLGGVTKGVR
ncbi:hypothetical protein ACFY05_01430 [Microtetraspora fusca]|uniref:Uncharacterized protein n=1 Tax=Microtetraspora fusca TaxID=1997 RepID=A0ABW6UXR8_MICFU